MQYEKPIMEIIKNPTDDIVCISNGGYDDNDGDFNENYGRFI